MVSADYGVYFDEEKFWESPYNNWQYVVGQDELFSWKKNFSRSGPNRTTSEQECWVSINGVECNSCGWTTCADGLDC